MSWAENQPAIVPGGHVEAVPNQSLKGKLASFEDIGQGDVVFDVDGAQTIDIFYKPRVDFGVELRDSAGETVDANKIVGGEYTLDYGFMDTKCAFIRSDLLGDIEYTTRITRDQ